MQILHVVPSRQTSYGGPVRVAEYIADYMQATGDQVRIFPEHDELTRGRWYLPEFKSIKRLYECVKWADVVHIHGIWTFPTTFASVASNFTGTPYFVNPHGMLDVWQLKQSKWVKLIYSLLLEKRNLKKATAVCFTHDEEMQEAAAFSSFLNAFILPNAVDTAVFENLPDRVELERLHPQTIGKTAMFFMARLHPKKGLDLLLKAIGTLPKDKKEKLILLIAGERSGEYYGEMMALVGSLSLQKQVAFVGEVLGDQKAVYLGGADIFALTSHQEGDSIALKEAMASGLPLLMTRQCHYPDWELAGFAKVVDTDISQIAAAINCLLSDSANLKEMGVVAARYAKDNFHTEVVYRGLRDGYLDAIAGTRNSVGWFKGEGKK